MKKVLYSLLICTSATLFAQKNPNVKFAVLNDIVGTTALFDGQKEVVQLKQNYKTTASLPQNLKKFSFLAEKGLSEFKLKNNAGILDNLSIASLNKSYKIPAETPVVIEGYEFSNPDTMIFGEILQNVEVKDNNGKKSLFVTTTAKK